MKFQKINSKNVSDMRLNREPSAKLEPLNKNTFSPRPSYAEEVRDESSRK